MKLMHALVVQVGLLLCIASCGGGSVVGTTPRNQTFEPKRVPSTPEKVVNYEDENSIGMSKQRVRRWRWRGERKRCYFVIENDCFASKRAACKAAQCKQGAKCVADKGAPAQVRCEK